MKTGYIRTSSGMKFYPFDPKPDQISVEDIATGLANTCRFAGQLPVFYSVARHSIIVSNLLPKEYALDGLFHDAAEAYLGDLVRPAKQDLFQYRELENRVHIAISEALDLNSTIPYQVKIQDQIVLEMEFQHFFPGFMLEDFPPLERSWTGLPLVKTSGFYSSPHIDKYAFLVRYQEILRIQ